jgi:hypothetical protein
MKKILSYHSFFKSLSLLNHKNKSHIALNPISESLSLNLKAGKVYPKVKIIQPDLIETPYLYHALNGLGAHICSIVIDDKKDSQNIIHTIYMEPEYRGMGYAVPIYWTLAEKIGSICSGEFRPDGTPTSFVSPSAHKVWKRLGEITKLEKIKDLKSELN